MLIGLCSYKNVLAILGHSRWKLTLTQIVSLRTFSFVLTAILNSQEGCRCTLVPRLPFPVPRSPFPVPDISNILYFAVCVTNFVAASFHLKKQEWLDMFRQFVWLAERVILFCRCCKFYLSMLLSVQVSLVKMPPKRTIESFYCFIKAKLSTY